MHLEPSKQGLESVWSIGHQSPGAMFSYLIGASVVSSHVSDVKSLRKVPGTDSPDAMVKAQMKLSPSMKR